MFKIHPLRYKLLIKEPGETLFACKKEIKHALKLIPALPPSDITFYKNNCADTTTYPTRGNISRQA